MNITQLKQGSLNGLRRQTNECIDNAYRKGYEDGKKEPREVTNVEDTNEYQIGYKVGLEDGNKIADEDLKEIQDSTYDVAYNKGVEDFENLFVYEPDYEQFFEDTYGSKDPDYNLFDLVVEYGAKKVLNDFNNWQEEKKKAEEEFFKVGDEVIGSSYGKAIVTMVDDDNVMVVFIDGSCGEFNKETFKKTGRHFDEIEQLLDKLRGDNND